MNPLPGLDLDLVLHPIGAFLSGEGAIASADAADYHYRGCCPRTGQHYSLPRTAFVKAVAQGLMAQLQLNHQTEGKMYGVLLVQTPEGEIGVLKAFSGQGQRPGWVPSIPGRSQVVLQEARTLDQLQTIKQRLIELQQLPARTQLVQLQEDYARDRHHLNQRHRDRKQARDVQRQALTRSSLFHSLAAPLAALEKESRGDKAELRQFKQRWRDRLVPLEAVIQAADAEMATLKQRRRDLSRQLQADLHAAYSLTNFAGESAAIQALAGKGNLPTGTGDCCAPKLLHTAAQYGLKPLTMAEFWWGPPQGNKRSGEFYGACTERCQPIMGFLLSGLSAQVLQAAPKVNPPSVRSMQQTDPADVMIHRSLPDPSPLHILYQDPWIIAVDKPPRLLSVPGRYGDRQDSVLTRLQRTGPDGAFLQPVHRLDQDTSGVLMLALDAETHRQLSRQFEQRQVQKTYQAIVTGPVSTASGLIDLPLWGDPSQRPRQSVNWQQGKPSQTRFDVLGQEGDYTRLAFYPLTGRTHQLRVHAAHPQGLDAPIWGDRLYGSPLDVQPLGAQPLDAQRLHLHAQVLCCEHPQTGNSLRLVSEVPF